MLPEMGKSLLVRLLIAATDIEHDTAMRNLGMRYLPVRDANPVRQGNNFVIFHS